MSTNDEREALRSDSVAAAAKRHEAAEARWKEVVSVGLCEDDEPTKQAFTVGYVLALASLPAPAPAAVQTCDLCAGKCRGHSLTGDPAAWEPEPGSRAYQAPAPDEAVAFMFTSNVSGRITFGKSLRDCPRNWKAAPLYAAPQPPEQCANIAQKSEQAPATGGDAVEPLRRAIMAAENLLAELEGSEAELDAEDQAVVHGAKQDIAFARAALANHSPDAGGVGEAWVCDGIPDEVIEAGISAWDAAKHDMENYVSGVTTDWDEGMIVAAIYKAMSAALNPADAEGGE